MVGRKELSQFYRILSETEVSLNIVKPGSHETQGRADPHIDAAKLSTFTVSKISTGNFIDTAVY